ncbi:MAG: glycosyltransferase family 39 protein [Elusimicrobiota bacterium]|nr:glycosyltransferase family 39 protein [Endomicrobiia bacterium]MCX7956508.1 glycosyltransferase family 39 protein [Endomicrobiia bacterium]MDW8055620.1 glycosyltransferase family 39 protein [Elusimicrobiota bacterium]MDW8166484.1 glycosyltransferase family 39 protein [Elusimicrobiota bacterium]
MLIKKEYWLLLGIIILSFVLRIVAINWQLPCLYQTEEYKTVNYALRMAAKKNLNPEFFEYPSLYLYFMLFIYGGLFIVGKILGFYSSAENFAVKFFQNPTMVYVIGRVFSTLFGTLVVLLTYILGKYWYNKRVGIIASLLLGILPIWVVYSHYIKPEMFSNLLIVLSSLILYRYYLTKNRTLFYTSCAILGLAVSSKYLSLPAGIIIPIIYFSLPDNRKKINTFLIGLAIIIIFFIIGTPYAILDYKTFLTEIKGIVLGPQQGLKRNIIYGLQKTFLDWVFMGNTLPLIGGVGLLGIAYCMIKRKLEDILLVSIFCVYSLINITHYFPAWGFLFSAFPFYTIAAGRFVDEIIDKSLFVKLVFVLIIISSLIESIIVDIKFSLKDTRTLALEWIVKNIPYGEKILIDRYPNSPPLKMTKKQLEKLYKKAVELNHYKKEYFYWQLKAHPGENYGYEIYEVYHPPYEIGTVQHQVEEAQKVRELIDVSEGIEYIKKFGIKYIILNSWSKTETVEKFYDEVEKQCKLIQKFEPKTKLHPGPVIWIYNLQ